MNETHPSQASYDAGFAFFLRSGRVDSVRVARADARSESQRHDDPDAFLDGWEAAFAKYDSN